MPVVINQKLAITLQVLSSDGGQQAAATNIKHSVLHNFGGLLRFIEITAAGVPSPSLPVSHLVGSYCSRFLVTVDQADPSQLLWYASL